MTHKLKQVDEAIDVRDKWLGIKQLKNIHDALEKLSEACPGGDMPLSECPILDHLYPKKTKNLRDK